MKKPQAKKSKEATASKKSYVEQKTVALSCLVGAGVAFIVLALAALVMNFADVPHGAVIPITILAVVAGCFTAGYLCGKTIRSQGLLYGLICGTVLFLFAFICELIFVREGISILMLYKYIIYIASAMIGGVLGVNRRRKVR